MKQLFLSIFLTIPLIMAAQKWQPIYAPFDSLCLRCELSRHDGDVLKELPQLVAQMRAMADSLQDRRLLWRALFWHALCCQYGEQDQSAQVVEKIDSALALVDSINYPYDYHRMLWVKTNATGGADMVAIYRTAQQELKYYKSIDDKLLMALMYLNIGRAYGALDGVEKALENYEMAFKIYDDIGYGKLSSQINIMNYYAMVGDTATLLNIYGEGEKTFKAHGDTMNLIVLYTNAMATGIDDKGFIKAYELARAFNRPNSLAYTAANLGIYYVIQNDFRKAIPYLLEGTRIPVWDRNNYYYTRLHSYHALIDCYDQLGIVDSAYYFTKKFYELNDSLLYLNSPANFQQLYEKLAMEREEEKIAEEQARARSRQLVTVLVFSVLLLLVALVAYYMYTSRRLKEAENQRLLKKMENEQLSRQLYQERSENSERELATNSLLLIEKKKMIEHLNKQIDQHSDEGNIKDQAKRDLQQFIRLHQGTEESLSQFYSYFSQVHPDFFTTLKEAYPTLTNGDLRLCAYLRIGLDNKQIAQVLSIQPDAVKKARYRLRQKFGLQTADSLTDFLLLIKIHTSEPKG